jgi:hypothetical protein
LEYNLLFFQYRSIVADISRQLLQCMLQRGVVRRYGAGGYRVHVDHLERGDTFAPGQIPQSMPTPRTMSTTAGGSVFYTAGTGTTQPFVTVNLGGDYNDGGGDAAAATQNGAGADNTGAGADGGGAGASDGGAGASGGGAGVINAQARAVQDGSDAKDSSIGVETPTHSGMASRIFQAVRKGACKISDQAFELKSSECLFFPHSDLFIPTYKVVTLKFVNVHSL